MATPKTTALTHRLLELDLSGCLYLNKYCRQKAVNQFFAGISRLGDGVFWYSLGAVLPLLYGSQGLWVTIEFATVGLVCLILYKTLKKRFYRVRPYVKSDKVFKGCAPLDFCSFPSGHTMHATAFTFVVLWHFPVFALILVPFSMLIAASRMVLGLHYPSDVLIGASLGLLIGFSGCTAFATLGLV